MIIYDEHPIKKPFTGRVKYENLDACKHWVTHYGNYKYLKFLHEKSPDFQERLQAQREMGVALRKMHWWERHPNFNIETVKPQRYAIDSQWNGRRA